MVNDIELNSIQTVSGTAHEPTQDALLDSFNLSSPVEDDTRLQQEDSSTQASQAFTTSIENRLAPAEPAESNASTLTTVKNHVRYMLTNAPLLRFVVPQNRYNSVRTSAPSVGPGQDGVFSNLSAKPSVQTGNEPSYQLPSYDEASQDPTPPYWEASIMAGFDDEIFVDGLPVGNIINFLWNMMVSVAFQFVGFVITYLLHTSHAAKNGSQAGLGITLISFGYSSIPISYGSNAQHEEQRLEPVSPNIIDIDSSNALDGDLDKFTSKLPLLETSEVEDPTYWNTTPVFSYALIALGIFLIVKALISFSRARRAEKAILQPQLVV
ncbi:hypothetical protein OGAPHI_001607 [Ogataea philodendri]|uniref:Metal homeostatis protein BSD2 n=1 Tax=Ogataea philodendri TaxID=1378263 RepID=A0A9P8T8Z3_9ASCO|nr:uncharacterized protein OGAPHI_001607 [Ogataea philodendri]KAH3669486.1 hypothetical protein OGAPHI_001607 [Ogataea philodendri]